MSSMLGTVCACGIKVKVTLELAKFNHLIFQITRSWLFIAESGKSYNKRHQLYISYRIRYAEGSNAQLLMNLPCMQIILVLVQEYVPS